MYIHCNYSSCIFSSIIELQSLIELKLNCCALKSLPIHQLPITIIWLELRENHLRTLSGDIANRLQYLEYLNIDRNHLRSLPVSFDRLNSLIELSAASNEITQLPNVCVYFNKSKFNIFIGFWQFITFENT